MIIIIGTPHHGGKTLAQAIKTITGKQCEVMNTSDLRLITKEKTKLEEELKEISIGQLEELKESDNRNHRKKSKVNDNFKVCMFGVSDLV